MHTPFAKCSFHSQSPSSSSRFVLDLRRPFKLGLLLFFFGVPPTEAVLFLLPGRDPFPPIVGVDISPSGSRLAEKASRVSSSSAAILTSSSTFIRFVNS